MILHILLNGNIHLAAHHGLGDAVYIGFGCGDILNHVTVPHDNHLVAHGQDLVEAVGNKDDGNAPLGHTADGIQQRIRFLLRQHGGGLIQDQQLQLILAQLSCNFGKLLMTDRHIADAHVGIDVDTHLLDGGIRTLIHFFIVQGVQPGAEHFGQNILLLGLTVEQNIFRGSKAGNQREFLMHHTDTGFQCIEGGGEIDLFSIEQHIAAITTGFPNHIHTEKDLHQSRLTGAIFTDQAQDLAGFQSKIDVFQNLISEEILLDVSHLQQRSSFLFHKQFLTCKNRGESFPSPLFRILFDLAAVTSE